MKGPALCSSMPFKINNFTKIHCLLIDDTLHMSTRQKDTTSIITAFRYNLPETSTLQLTLHDVELYTTELTFIIHHPFMSKYFRRLLTDAGTLRNRCDSMPSRACSSFEVERPPQRYTELEGKGTRRRKKKFKEDLDPKKLSRWPCSSLHEFVCIRCRFVLQASKVPM